MDRHLDAAVLDLNLEGTWSYPIAERLDADGVPYLFITGYDPWAMPNANEGKIMLAKPYRLATVVERLVEPCGGVVHDGARRLARPEELAGCSPSRGAGRP